MKFLYTRLYIKLWFILNSVDLGVDSATSVVFVTHLEYMLKSHVKIKHKEVVYMLIFWIIIEWKDINGEKAIKIVNNFGMILKNINDAQSTDVSISISYCMLLFVHYNLKWKLHPKKHFKMIIYFLPPKQKSL